MPRLTGVRIERYKGVVMAPTAGGTGPSTAWGLCAMAWKRGAVERRLKSPVFRLVHRTGRASLMPRLTGEDRALPLQNAISGISRRNLGYLS